MIEEELDTKGEVSDFQVSSELVPFCCHIFVWRSLPMLGGFSNLEALASDSPTFRSPAWAVLGWLHAAMLGVRSVSVGPVGGWFSEKTEQGAQLIRHLGSDAFGGKLSVHKPALEEVPLLL